MNERQAELDATRWGKTDVSGLLEQSRAAHALYRRLPTPKPDGWQVHLWDAYTARQKAAELDPQRKDVGWAFDRVYHGHLMTFYRGQLGLNG